MAEVQLRAADDGGSVTARVGDHIVIVLEENATTGYRWTIAGVNEVVTVVSDGYPPSQPGKPPAPGGVPAEPVVGRGGNREFRLEAVSPGVATIVLTLKREWEDDDTSGIARWGVSINVT